MAPKNNNFTNPQLEKEAAAAGLELVSRGNSTLSRTYRSIRCGHLQDRYLSSVKRLKIKYCAECNKQSQYRALATKGEVFKNGSFYKVGRFGFMYRKSGDHWIKSDPI